jgi:signal transduction histidine kinase
VSELKQLPQTGDLRISYSVLQRQADRLQRILKISQTLTGTLDLDKLLSLILSAATELTDTEAASILLLDESGSELHFTASSGQSIEKLAELKVPIEGSLAGSILTSGKPMVIENVRQDPRHYGGVDQQLAFVSRSILGVPLMLQDKSIGVLEAVNKRGDGTFSEEDGQVLMTLAAQAAVAIENAQLVTALQLAYKQLNEVDQLKSNFIAIASHELRTPLGLILGYAAMLKDDASAETARQLDVVLHSALRLRGLIDDMVNLQYVAEGKAELEIVEFSIQDLVQVGVQSVNEICTSKQHTLTFDLPPQPLCVKADRAKIALVLNNLLTNAIKFTEPRGRIAVSAETHDGELQVHVADTGVGVPAGDLELIFDRFYQVEPHLTRKHGGLGLGLAIAKGMVEMHGGRIWCESVEGQGSRFTFSLPINGPRVKKSTGMLRAV